MQLTSRQYLRPLVTQARVSYRLRVRAASHPCHRALRRERTTPTAVPHRNRWRDQLWWSELWNEAGNAAGIHVVNLNLVPDAERRGRDRALLDQDAIWVGGGSVANLLADLETSRSRPDPCQSLASRRSARGSLSRIVVLAHRRHDDSFGPELRPVTNGLGLLPYANGVHYDSEPQRRPLFQQLIGDGVLPKRVRVRTTGSVSSITDQLRRSGNEIRGRGAYLVRREGTRRPRSASSREPTGGHLSLGWAVDE